MRARPRARGILPSPSAPRGLFQTPPETARELLDMVDAFGPSPRRVLDLASGGGGLWRPALERWPGTRLVTVDEDPAASRPSPPHVHHVADVLTWSGTRRGEDPDLVLCNPPYVRSARYGACQGGGARSVEAAFVARCLSSCRPGGLVALVLPDGLATGRASLRFREDLFARHAVLHVAQVAPRTFARTEARVFLLVARAWTGPTGRVVLSGPRGADGATAQVEVTAPEALRRMDWTHHSAALPGGVTLASLDAMVVRGRLSRRMAETLGIPAFHVDGFPVEPGTCVPLRGGDDHAGAGILAEAGDVLVGRLGRNLHRQVCLVSSGTGHVTDAVFVVRVAPHLRGRVLTSLSSAAGTRRLDATARGVGMRMLGKGDLMAMPLPDLRPGP